MILFVFVATLDLPAAPATVHLGDYWELVDTKTGQFLGDHLKLAYTSRDLASVPTYVQLILDGLGCSAEVSSAAPCKFQKLFVDAGANGSPAGRDLATAIIKGIEKDGRLKLVTNRKEADAVFGCHNELIEEKLKGLGADASSGTLYRWIAYIVDTQSCDDIKTDLTYSAGKDETEQSTVETPWGDLNLYSDGVFYSISAQKHDASGCDVTAEIYDIKLTMDQSFFLLRLPEDDMVLYLRLHGNRLRKAASDAAYGIATVDYAGQE